MGLGNGKGRRSTSLRNWEWLGFVFSSSSRPNCDNHQRSSWALHSRKTWKMVFSSPSLFLALPAAGGDFHMEQAGERAKSCSSRLRGGIRHHPAMPPTGRVKERVKTPQDAGKLGKSREETPEE